jgi:protein-tyrosine-phosphatase
LITAGIVRSDKSSCAKIFNSYSIQLNYGGCSLVAERTVVVRVAGVRFSPFTLIKGEEMKKILFVCKYNAFRSRVAEEYFNKINKNKNIQARSCGIIAGGNSDKEQLKTSKKILGINIQKRKSRVIEIKDLLKSNLIIIVADDVPKIIFNFYKIKAKIIVWKIKDEWYKNERNIEKLVLTIKNKVDKLNKSLEKK